jgi:hypothetical protein
LIAYPLLYRWYKTAQLAEDTFVHNDVVGLTTYPCIIALTVAADLAHLSAALI